MLNFSNAFSASVEMIMWFLFFILFMWCITLLICICWTILVNVGWIPLAHGVWSFLRVVRFGWLTYFWEFFIYIHQRYWPEIIFFGSVFVWFWSQGDGGFIECLWECSLLFSFLEEFETDWYKKFFVCLVEFTCEAIWSWTFVCREFLNYRFYFTSSDKFVQIICFFLIQF